MDSENSVHLPTVEDMTDLVRDCGDPDLRWLPANRARHGIDRAWLSWLLDPGSLTQRLKQLSDNDFRVVVMDERWSWNNSRSLQSCFGKVLARQAMWSRKVILAGEGRPWVAAHSLIPVSSLNSPLKRICKLQDRPLGEFLFASPGLSRSQLEITVTGNTWGRRSLFHLYGHPVLVAEFFLPEFAQAGIEQQKK